MPKLDKFNRDFRNKEWRKKYEAGATLQDLADEYGGKISLSTISRAIVSAGGEIRPSGGSNRRKARSKGLLAWLDSSSA